MIQESDCNEETEFEYVGTLAMNQQSEFVRNLEESFGQQVFSMNMYFQMDEPYFYFGGYEASIVQSPSFIRLENNPDYTILLSSF